jgi:hypothetical protein
MSTIFISHKLINEFKQKLPDLVQNSDDANKVLQYVKQMLRYDENQKTYTKEKYEKYNKKYYEENKERINKHTVESRKKKKLEQKNKINSIEISLNTIKI